MISFISGNLSSFWIFFQIFIKYSNFFTVKNNGSYKGVIKSSAVYKGTNKDYSPDAKPSKGKMHCPRA